MYYFLLMIGVILLDRYTKYLVFTNMPLHSTLPVIQEVLHITYIHNYGAAFSTMQGRLPLLVGITGIVCIALLIYIIKSLKTESKVLLTSLSLIIAGGVGNLIDRVVFGYVVDFIDFRVFPIFNVADISVCCGCGLLILYILILEPRKAKNQEIATRQASE